MLDHLLTEFLNDLIINQQKRSSLSSLLAPGEERRAMLEALSKGMTLASQPISSVDFLSIITTGICTS